MGTGGMQTKIAAAKIAVGAGCHLCIAKGAVASVETHRGGRALHLVRADLDAGGHPQAMDRRHPEAGRGDRRRRGCGACPDGRQEPAAGGGDPAVGRFDRGDTVSILGPDGSEVARGICAYSDGDAARIIGRKSADIEKVLGFRGRDEIVHRDDLVLLRAM
jgi:glutamate 5-kinase